MSNVSLINGHIEKRCENCKYYDVATNDMPCRSCDEFENWEESEVDGQ